MKLFIISLFFVNIFANITITYPNLKKYYYQNQIVNLKVKILNPEKKELNFSLNKGEINITKEPYMYNLTLKFKNTKNNILEINSSEFNKTIHLNSLFKTKEIEKIPNYCNVTAEDIQILNPISTLTNKKILLSFSIKTKNANLEDFKLKEDNLTLINKSEATYYIYLPKNIKKFSFFYFNTKEENFKKITIPINLKEETISTQTNINPEERNFFTPLNILILIIIAFFLIIFLVYQNLLILTFPIILFAYLIYTILPKGEKILKANSNVRILPTKNSTIFFIPKNDIKVKILNQTKNYTKIKINNKIGWVKNENLR